MGRNHGKKTDHVEQAKLVFEVNEIDPNRYRFIQSNIFDVDFKTLGQFDVVLCLGLMYHITRHIELMQRIAQVNSYVLIIDTRLSTLPGSLMELRRESIEDHRNAIDSGLIMVPTKQAVIDMAEETGYHVVVMAPTMQQETSTRDSRSASAVSSAPGKPISPRCAPPSNRAEDTPTARCHF